MEAGELLAGRYRLELTLGKGGMGRVWRAHDVKLDRPVAVKVLTDQRDPDARARFVREGRAAARLSHPNVVAVYDADEVDGHAYLVMELVEGMPLDQMLRDHGRLAFEHVRAIGADVTAALTAAHTAGIVHRDIKPANLVQSSDGRVRVLDFGIARVLDEGATRLTQTGMVIGTPAYLAPEQIQTGESMAYSDMYGLGCVLYELLCGRPPFTGDAMTLMYAHVSRMPEPLTHYRTGVPEDLDVLVRAMLEKPPHVRPTAEQARQRFAAGIAASAAAASGGPAVAQPSPTVAMRTAQRSAAWLNRQFPRPLTASVPGAGVGLLGLMMVLIGVAGGSAGVAVVGVGVVVAGVLVMMLINWARIAASVFLGLGVLAQLNSNSPGSKMWALLCLGMLVPMWLPASNRAFRAKSGRPVSP